MIHAVAIFGYRSIRDLVLPLGQLNVVTGANGAGKSSLYRALRLLADAASNRVVSSLAHEGGLPSVLWAGPEVIARSVRAGEHMVEPLAPRKPAALKLGFAGRDFCYSIELGLPPPAPAPPPLTTLFTLDPAIKRECIWHGAVYRSAAALVNRRGNLVSLKTERGRSPTVLTTALNSADSMLASIADPERAPEMLAVREYIRSWRFYDNFRVDGASPVRAPQIGTFTPVLNNEGTDLAAAIETILEIGDGEQLARTVEDALPGSQILIEAHEGRFELKLQQHGLLRKLAASELSDGTLRFLLWTAALLTPRPPELMVLNEPETSLHPDLLPALARLIGAASLRCQIVVVSHSQTLIGALEEQPGCSRLQLEKSFGETRLLGQTSFNSTRWEWPSRG